MFTQCSFECSCMFLECSLNFSQGSLNVPSVLPWMFLHVPWMFLHVPWMFPQYSLDALSMFPWDSLESSLNIPWIFLHVPWMFLQYSPNTPSMFSQCSLACSCMFPECLQVERPPPPRVHHISKVYQTQPFIDVFLILQRLWPAIWHHLHTHPTMAKRHV